MIRNIHERVINAPLEPLGVLLDGLGQKDDRLWPSRYWPPMVLDRPLALGADGGHDDIYYYVSEYEPGRRVRFSFRPRTGLIGAHELSLDALDERRTRIRHVLIGRTRGAMRLMFSAAVEPLHDAVLAGARAAPPRPWQVAVTDCSGLWGVLPGAAAGPSR